MQDNQKETAVLTKTKTGTVMKTLLAVTVITASLAALGAFGMMTAKGIRGFIRPTLIVRVSRDTPPAQQITAPASDVDLFHLNLRVRGNKRIHPYWITFGIETDLAPGVAHSFRLYGGDGTLVGGPNQINPYHQTVTFAFSGNEVLPRKFKLILKADIGQPAGDRLIKATINPAQQINILNPPPRFRIRPNRVLSGNIMTILPGVQAGNLVVSLNSSSPSGMATPGSNKEVLRIDLTASGSDITIRNIEVLMAGWANITGTGSATWRAADNSVLYATFIGGADNWLNPGNDFDVVNDAVGGTWDNPLVIAEGTTKTIKLIGDTTGAWDNHTLQAKIIGSSNTVSGVVWEDEAGNVVDSLGTQFLPIEGGVLAY